MKHALNLFYALRLRVSGTYWAAFYKEVLAGVACRTLEVLGLLLLVVEVGNLFRPDWAQSFTSFWPWCIALGFVISVVWGWPKLSRKCRVAGRDVIVELRVTDIFTVDADIVVPANSTFDTDVVPNGVMLKGKSIQAQVFRRNYDSVSHLDRDIDAALDGQGSVGTPVSRQKPGKKVEFPIGTVALLAGRKDTSYWFAVGRVNHAGRAESSREDVLSAIPLLWDYIRERGDTGSLAVPLFGTGLSRTNLTREESAKAIVRSFLAATQERRFCDHLVLVVHPVDYIKHGIDLSGLFGFIEAQCMLAELNQPEQGRAAGTEVAAVQ